MQAVQIEKASNGNIEGKKVAAFFPFGIIFTRPLPINHLAVSDSGPEVLYITSALGDAFSFSEFNSEKR